MGKLKRAAVYIVLLWLCADITLACTAFSDYREKTELLALALEGEMQGEDTLAHVTGYLRGTYHPEREELEKLARLGYTEDYFDLRKKQLVRDLAVYFVLLTALAAAAFLGLAVFYRKEAAAWDRTLEKLCSQIQAVRSGEYLPPETEEMRGGFVRLHEELDMLARHTSQIREEARLEKEATKALVTDLSHQIRTPLAALKAGFDILSGEQLEEAEYEEFFRRCSAQIDRLTELSASLLQISRLETGLIEIELQKAPLFDTILTAVNRIYPKAVEKGIEVILEETDNHAEMTEIPQDGRWLSEAVINILENAVKYSERGASVRIRVQRLTVSVRIEIEDEGIGILPEEKNRIFQRFYRGKEERVQREKGQGIGLYLTRQIIEKHHGTIKVMPVKPHGSRFVIQLPL